MRGAVIDTLLDIPSHVRGRLGKRSGIRLLAPPWTAMAIRAAVGGGCEEPILHVLREWDASASLRLRGRLG